MVPTSRTRPVDALEAEGETADAVEARVGLGPVRIVAAVAQIARDGDDAALRVEYGATAVARGERGVDLKRSEEHT